MSNEVKNIRVEAGSGETVAFGVDTIEAIAGPDYVVLVVVLTQLIIFISSLMVIHKLWMAVLDIVRNKSSKKAEALVKVLGSVDLNIDNEMLRIKAIGTGIASTIAILACSILAMFVIGNHTVI